MEKIIEFKKELATLLSKYNATIEFNFGAGSDLHGVYDEQIAVSFKEDRKEITETLSAGYCCSAYDILLDLKGK